MRLIDADALMQTYAKFVAPSNNSDFEKEPTWNDAVSLLESAQTVDAVEVVRCKDCVYCKRYNNVWYLPKRDELLCTLYVETYGTTENDYCSRGERKDETD